MDPSRVRKTDRGLVSKWEKDLGFSREMILTAAAYAADATIPTTYLDKILTEYKEKGITTPEQAEKERKQYRMTSGKTAGKPARTVVAQQYEQRDYTGVQDELIAQQDKDMEEFMRNENGGKPDA
jgi:DnaD/phage-associated family protein